MSETENTILITFLDSHQEYRQSNPVNITQQELSSISTIETLQSGVIIAFPSNIEP